MINLKNFSTSTFVEALKTLFHELQVPVNYVSDQAYKVTDVFGKHYKKNNESHKLIDKVYVLGTIDDTSFTDSKNVTADAITQADYSYILVMGIELKIIDNRLPSRSMLAELTRLANKAFNTNEKGNPVTVVFKYADCISLANTERQARTSQDWREGEKLGKVTILRDVNHSNTHAGHIRILLDLKIQRTGSKAIDSFEKLYSYWHAVFNTSILNKKFYAELSNWYFWAISEVTFPNEPIRLDFGENEDDKYNDAVKEHRAKNVIRLLTRILFIWFIKEKGLIPEEIFDEKIIGEKYLDEFEPQKDHGIFAVGKHKSRYYRAILQNLFFATLNQTVSERKFRKDKEHMNVTQLMRYKSYLKDPAAFITLMESTVPFMNGGLFECLDKPHDTIKSKQGGDKIIYVDGFSDRDDNVVDVPDFLFFDEDEEVDLSGDYGDKKFKTSKTKGLFAILKSYKFTITENTPIEEDIALDPELLGKVFENLLASYNPETKSTARKQTGSFYTPREIVNYMVEESLIAYLKNALVTQNVVNASSFNNVVDSSSPNNVDPAQSKDVLETLEGKLRELVSFSLSNPFEHDAVTNKKIIEALDNCKILDPACGSGAFPMGILQKMVHILHKVDANNTEWKDRQLHRVDNALAELEKLDDAKYRDLSIKELELQKKDIEEAFTNNELDYGRKLYLIENCIYGVDIQPIATQISKLRFFISLVVDQKVDKTKDNFGIRPLPNLETKFVAANTLIGIEKPKEKQGDLFANPEIAKLEQALKKVRQKLFSSKVPSRKRELREEDKALREQMSELLIEEYGQETAKQLASWDPYDQNTSSSFFDPEWMFDISQGFDVVIGNPPYGAKFENNEKAYLKRNYKARDSEFESYIIFIEKSTNYCEKAALLFL